MAQVTQRECMGRELSCPDEASVPRCLGNGSAGPTEATRARRGLSGPGAGKMRVARRGSTILEFAIIFPIFGLLMMGTADVGRSLFYLTTLQHGVREAGRLVMTGNVVSGQTRPESVASMIRRSSGIQVSEDDIEMSSISGDGTVTPGPGGPGDVVTISVGYDVPMITPFLAAMFPDGIYRVVAGTSFKNEEFRF